jgi:hypothetical protein
MEKSNIDIEQIIYDETEKRLAEMKKPGYEFPARIGQIDVLIIIAAIVVSALLIILCMVGVIV